MTCDVASLEPGGARRSLLLTPSGHVRADFTVAQEGDGFLLLQAPDQPEGVDRLLARYVLSSDVTLDDMTGTLALFGVIGAIPPGADATQPSTLGAGVDLTVPVGDPAARLGRDLAGLDLIEVGPDARNVWRVRRGDPRMGVDFDGQALPAEVGLERTIDATKGCFLGQESVARVRNLGHPPRVLRHLRADAALAAGVTILAGKDRVGAVTSAVASRDGGSIALAVIAWRARDARLVTSDGLDLVAVGSLD